MDQLSLDDLQRKPCTKCGEVKDLDLFPVRHFSTDRPGRPGSWCKACVTAHTMAWQRKNPERHRAKQRRRKLRLDYGLTSEEYEVMLAKQGGRCMVCGTTRPSSVASRTSFDVDHDHVTGKLRDLLCQGCNMGIGNFLDDPQRMEAAAAYIRRHREAAS